MAIPVLAAVDIHYVSLTGANSSPYTALGSAARSIQAAVNVATAGDTVLISAGTYVLTSEIMVSNSITVRSSSGPNVTIVDGGKSYRCFSITNGTTLGGLTLTNGYSIKGGGVYLNRGGIVSNCIITSCSTTPTGSGGGAYLDRGGIIKDSQILRNYAAGAVLGDGGAGVYCLSNGTISASTISYNTCLLDGGGIYLSGGGMASNCIIQGNVCSNGYGGAVQLAKGGQVEACDLAYNHAMNYYGGGACADGGGILRNTVIRHNQADSGSGGVCAYNGAQIISCTIIGNKSNWAIDDPGTAGGLYCETNNILENTIIFNNEGPIISDLELGAANITPAFCCVAESPPGNGHITSAPIFIPFTDEYHQASNSPTVDKGTNRTWMTGAIDIDGQSRKLGTCVDIGADEYAPTPVPPAPYLPFVAEAGGPYPTGEGRTVNLSGANSKPGGPTTLRYKWNFGDNTCQSDWSTSAISTHVYVYTGSYTGQLAVVNTNSLGIDTYIVNVTSIPPVVVAGGPFTNVFAEEPLFIDATGSGTGTYNTLRYRYDFGSGFSGWSLSPSVAFTYPAACSTNFTVQIGKFLYWDSLTPDSTGQDIPLVSVAPPLRATISGGPFSTTEGSTLGFPGSRTGGSTGGLSCRWNFGSGWSEWGSTGTVFHTFSDEETGSYTVSLQVTNNWNVNSTSITVTVANVAPTLTDFSVSDDIWLNTPASLNVSASDPGTSDTIEYSYLLDGQWSIWSASPIVNYTFTNGGNATVSVKVRDLDGGTGLTANASIQVIVAQATGLSPASGAPTLRWNVVTNRAYRIQRTADLMLPQWTNISALITSPTNPILFVDTNNPPAKGYYRAVLQN